MLYDCSTHCSHEQTVKRMSPRRNACMCTPTVSSRPVVAGVETFSGNGTPSASKSSLDSPGLLPPSVVIGDSESPHGASTHSGTPLARGSPASAGSGRDEDTPGYGGDTGPPNQRSSIATGKSLIHGMKRSW